jgi:DNA mismatch repair protein MutS2
MLQYGRKINELLHKYFQTNNKKQLTADFNNWLVVEKTKYLKKNPPKPKTKVEKKKLTVEKKQAEEKLKVVEKEVLVAVEKVREEKIKVDKVIAKQKADYVFKINDKVRIIDSNTVGTIDKIEKKNAFINYGVFTTKTTLNKLELVQAAKK